MSYIELRHYRFHVLEVREYGDTGWAVHVYLPKEAGAKAALKVFQTVDPSKLNELLAEARAAVDAAPAQKPARLRRTAA